MSEEIKKYSLAKILVKELGISLKTAYNKLNGDTNFTLTEYLWLCETWGDDVANSLIKKKELINDLNNKKGGNNNE